MEVVSRYCVQIGQTPMCFQESFNGITVIPHDSSLPTNTNPSEDLQRLIKGYVLDAQKVLERYPKGIRDVVNLDFSRFGLTHPPPPDFIGVQSGKDSRHQRESYPLASDPTPRASFGKTGDQWK